jgi:hypothetical protein
MDENPRGVRGLGRRQQPWPAWKARLAPGQPRAAMECEWCSGRIAMSARGYANGAEQPEKDETARVSASAAAVARSPVRGATLRASGTLSPTWPARPARSVAERAKRPPEGRFPRRPDPLDSRPLTVLPGPWRPCPGVVCRGCPQLRPGVPRIRMHTHAAGSRPGRSRDGPPSDRWRPDPPARPQTRRPGNLAGGAASITAAVSRHPR